MNGKKNKNYHRLSILAFVIIGVVGGVDSVRAAALFPAGTVSKLDYITVAPLTTTNTELIASSVSDWTALSFSLYCDDSSAALKIDLQIATVTKQSITCGSSAAPVFIAFSPLNLVGAAQQIRISAINSSISTPHSYSYTFSYVTYNRNTTYDTEELVREVAPLATIAATQSGSWAMGVNNFPALQMVGIDQTNFNNTVSGEVVVFQGTSPWITNATIQNAALAVTQSGAWNVGILGVPHVIADAGEVTVFQGTNPWTVDATIAGDGHIIVDNFPANQNVTITGQPIAVTETNPLTTLAVTQSGTWNINATLTAIASGITNAIHVIVDNITSWSGSGGIFDHTNRY